MPPNEVVSILFLDISTYDRENEFVEYKRH